MSTRARVILAGVVLLLLVGVGVGWLLESRTAANAPSISGSASAYRVKVTRQGEELASFDLVALQAVGMKKVVVQGGTEQGPAVLDVLRKAGVTQFRSITVLGTGQRDSGRIQLQSSEIGPETVLDIAKRGTVKIAGPTIPRDKRVRDVTEIQVN